MLGLSEREELPEEELQWTNQFIHFQEISCLHTLPVKRHRDLTGSDPPNLLGTEDGAEVHLVLRCSIAELSALAVLN